MKYRLLVVLNVFADLQDNQQSFNNHKEKNEMNPQLVSLTFKPLARGYFRCNQTGEKTKNCESYRRQMQNRGRNQIPDEAKNLPKVKLQADSRWECPNKRHHRFWQNDSNRSEKIRVIDTCDCGQKVYITGRN